MERMKRTCGWLVCVLLLLTSLGGCKGSDAGLAEGDNGDVLEPPAPLAAEFAAYREVPVDFSPMVEPYRVEPGLANVTNREMFNFSPEAERLLVENGFVVVPSTHREFFMLYEMNRYEPVPNFITTDSILHNYHLFFSHLLRVIEKGKLSSTLKELTEDMFSVAEKQYRALRGTEWENAAARNMAFFAVGGRLLDPSFPVPEPVKEIVERELLLIADEAGILDSPFRNMVQNGEAPGSLQEDYSQYIPRGHYNSSELLQRYFKAMQWYGRMTFRVTSEDETRSALLMTLALNQGDNGKKWDALYQPITFFVGKSDDLNYLQYRDLLGEIYGHGAGLKEIVSAEDKWETFWERAAQLRPPVINSLPIYEEGIQPDRIRETMGFRFLGQRFTLDAAIFQRLVYREVKENSQGERRMLPQALDIPAAMGSEEAYSILAEKGETDYQGYKENMAAIQGYIAGLEQESWTQNLYWSWLYTLKPLLEEKGEGYPSFMQNQAWRRKELNTFLGSWTELKHDTVLYAKQIYAEMGGGIEGEDDRGYVEPNPRLYARLAALVDMTREGLLARDLLEDRDRESLDRLEELTLALKTISEKELANIPLTTEEYDLIRSYGGQLEHFWLEALADEGVDHPAGIGENPAALVTDVATDPSGRVLQEATGYIFDIYAVVPVDGRLRIAKGGVYSHYEFTWPLEHRLTDKQWQEILDSGQAPPLAPWTNDFIAP